MARSSVIETKGLVDTHHHFFPASVPDLNSEFDTVIPGVPFAFPTTVEEHLEFMDGAGVQTAIISPSIQKEWSISWPAAKYLKLCEDGLDAGLGYVRHNPLRFGVFAMLPLPHIEESIKMIELSAAKSIPPDGYAVSTSHDSKYLGDESFDPVWDELNKKGAVVFVHPTDTAMPPNLKFPPFLLEFPFDTTRAIMSVITSGILTRYPRLQFIFSHLSGAFAFLVDRMAPMEMLVRKNNAGRGTRELLTTTNIFFDTAISSPSQYNVLKDIGFPTSHLLHATDYPYTAAVGRAYKTGIESPASSGVYSHEEVFDEIGRENALNLLFPRLKKEYEREFK